MVIGIDVSPLQGPHRMRGVGAVLINIINNLPDETKKSHSFVFYVENNEEVSSTLEYLDLSGVVYEIREKPVLKKSQLKLPWKFNILVKILHKQVALYRFWVGARGYDCEGLDAYLHTDQNHIMPKMKGVKKYMIAYDLIPYVLADDYLWTYRIARQHGLSLRASLAAKLRRQAYIRKLKINSKKAHKLLAISEQTKDDYTKHVGAKSKKVIVWYLGVNQPDDTLSAVKPDMQYIRSSWGYIKRGLSLASDERFILFVGGVDPRRKLDDLVTAFNHLRAEGYRLKLLMSGDVLEGPNNIPVKSTSEAFTNSSYSKDIVYLGYTTEQEKKWLYENALVLIYPSKYEGFGLPVIEAMACGTPVVTYKNTSIYEVAGDAAIYAYNGLSIKNETEKLIDNSSKLKLYAEKGRSRASKFTWEHSIKRLVDIVAG
jgi:glycosyltransferase involved in cell wall biosynthesis